MISKYVQAVIELFDSGEKPEMVLGGLSEILKKKGHERLHRPILVSALRQLEANSKARTATVILADKKDAALQKKSIKKILETLEISNENEYVLETDPNIVGGVLVESNDRRVDATYKSALLKLYRNITN